MKSLLKTRKTLTYSYNSFLACSLHSLLHCLLNSSCFHSLVVYLQAKINIALFCKSSSSLPLTRAASSSSSNCRWCKRKKTKEPLKSRTIDHRVAGSSPRGHVFFSGVKLMEMQCLWELLDVFVSIAPFKMIICYYLTKFEKKSLKKYAKGI